MINTLIVNVTNSLLTELESYKGLPVEHFVKNLFGIDESDKRSGLEINCITCILKKKYLNDTLNLYLISTESPDIQYLAEVLKLYYTPIFKSIKIVQVKDFNGNDLTAHNNRGLINLIKEIATIVKYHGENYCLQTILGDDGPQNILSLLCAQVFDIRVVSYHPDFNQIFNVPSIPVCFNIDLWMDNVELFNDTSTGLALQETGIKFIDLDPSLKPYFERHEDNQHYLSPIGEIMYQGFILKHPVLIHDQLPESAPDMIKKIIYEDQNYGKHRGLKQHIEKILKLPYITRVQTNYYNPALKDTRSFRMVPGDYSRIEGIYTNEKATTRFWIYTTAADRSEQRAVLADLLSHF